VQVRITIGTDGDVTKAEAISGHPILAEAAVEAAKKSLFNSRSKPTTRVMTYYFRLLDN
jgi:outer membrane biosynthesis protein TonB